MTPELEKTSFQTENLMADNPFGGGDGDIIPGISYADVDINFNDWLNGDDGKDWDLGDFGLF